MFSFVLWGGFGMLGFVLGCWWLLVLGWVFGGGAGVGFLSAVCCGVYGGFLICVVFDFLCFGFGGLLGKRFFLAWVLCCRGVFFGCVCVVVGVWM